MFTVPLNLITSGTIQKQEKRTLVGIHSSSDNITLLKFVNKSDTATIQNQSSATTQSLGSQELDFTVWIFRIDKASWMNLNLLHVNTLATNSFHQLQSIARRIVAVRCWQVPQVRPVLLNQRVLSKISSIPTSSQNYRPVQSRLLTTNHVLDSFNASVSSFQQAHNFRLLNQLNTGRHLLGNSFQLLH